LRRAGIDPLAIKYLIPKNTPNFGFAWLRLLSIADSQLILFDPYSELVGVKRLILPTLSRTGSRAHPPFVNAIEYLLSLVGRKRSIMTKSLRRRKVFVSRAGARREGRKLINRMTVEQVACSVFGSVVRFAITLLLPHLLQRRRFT
jgi:hypothetical protein